MVFLIHGLALGNNNEILGFVPANSRPPHKNFHQMPEGTPSATIISNILKSSEGACNI